LDAEIGSVYGKIQSSWKREGGKIRLTVVVPCNTTARLILPVTKQEHVLSSGVYTYVMNDPRYDGAGSIGIAVGR
ncbi:MAG: hypothetical protein LBH77_02630, partial [Tannerella sp.]|nr:hypothetical protein [Tannerella sp.]